MARPDNLQRFVLAQAPVFAEVCAELRAGRKTSHWMWFVFPQIAGLGMSAMSQSYAIADLDEATAYLAHPILGPRLIQCCQFVLANEQHAIEAIFGAIDAVKFHSCMTLFAEVPGADPIFSRALDRLCHGEADQKTLQLLGIG